MKGKKKTLKKGVCRVCELINGDTSEKDVFYCDVCKVWMCVECGTRYDRRALAAMLDKLSKGFNFFKRK